MGEHKPRLDLADVIFCLVMLLIISLVINTCATSLRLNALEAHHEEE